MDHIAEPLRHLAVPVADLRPDPKNARRHGDRNLAAVKAALDRFGQRLPLVVQRQGMIVRAGNARLQAAKELGWTHVAAVVVDEGDVEATAFAIADNRTAELAEWDDTELARTLERLRDEDAALIAAAGFSEAEVLRLARHLPENQRADADDVPDPPADPVTQPGDLWTLGEHLLLCGDATNAEHVARAIGANNPGLMVTDPPYGVNYDPAWRARAAEAGQLNFGVRRAGEVPNDDRSDWREAFDLFLGSVAYVWHAPGPAQAIVLASLEAAGFEARNHLIWAKLHFPISRGHYHHRHEPCWYVVRRGAAAGWCGDRRQTTVWADIALDRNVGGEDGGHSTQKPVECMARPMRNHEHRVVYDPFLGSGTTLIAAEMEGRRCLAIEISPRYCDVAVRRWERFTGKTATREPAP